MPQLSGAIDTTSGPGGTDTAILSFAKTGANGGYLLRPASGTAASSYTLIFDLRIDDAQKDYGALFQTNLANDEDGELFLVRGEDGLFGLGINGQYDGGVAPGAWARLAVTVTDRGDGTAEMVKYIDGAEIGRQEVESKRFTIAPEGFLILADESDETYAGDLAAFAWQAAPMTQAQIAALGGAQPGPILQDAGEAEVLVFDFADGMAHGEIPARIGAAMLDRGYLRSGGLTPAHSLDFAAKGPDGGYHVTPDITENLTDFTLIYDLMIPNDQPGDFGGLFQTDISNLSDGDLFLNRTGEGVFGIGIAGEYAGEVPADRWTRIAFTLTDLGTGESRLDKYVAGAHVGSQTVETARFTITPEGFLLLTDEDGETFSGNLARFALIPDALADEAAARLGTAEEGADLSSFHPAITGFDFAAGLALANGTAGASFGSAQMADRSFEPVAVADPLLHRLMKVGDDVSVDLAGRFAGQDLTLELDSSDDSAVAAVLDGTVLTLTARALGFADLRITARDPLGNVAEDNFRVRVAGDNAYTMVIFPDTQNYTQTEPEYVIFGQMTEFVARNADTLNVALVTHVGDVTQDNMDFQWQLTSEAYEAFDKAGLRYTLTAGNHDQAEGGTAKDHTSLIRRYFDDARYFAPAADGQDGDHGQYDGAQNGGVNTFKTFTAPDGTKWIAIQIEFGPRDDVLTWAGELLDRYADHRAILTTHHHMNSYGVAGASSAAVSGEGTGKNYGMVTDPEGTNDGRDIWDKLVARHPNVSLIVSGHVFGDGAATNLRRTELGDPVVQMLVNYQNGVAKIMQTAGEPMPSGRGGHGAMRILTIDPDNDVIETETYFAALDTFMTGSRGAPEPSREGRGEQKEIAREIQPLTFGPAEGLVGQPLPGDEGDTQVARIPRFNPDNALRVDPGFEPAGGGNLYDAYTLIWDVYIPPVIGLTSILQTDLDNISDGDLWVQRGEDMQGLIGGDRHDDGPFALDGWRRIVTVWERVQGDEVAYRCDKYVGGVLMGSQVFTGDRRVVTKDGFLLFADDGLETPEGWGFAAFAMVEQALTAEEATALGDAQAGGPFAMAPEGANAVQFRVDGDRIVTDFGPGEMTRKVGSSQPLSLTGRYRGHQESIAMPVGPVTGAFAARASAPAMVDLTQGGNVTLDASDSVDPFGQIAGFTWRDETGAKIGDSASVTVDARPGLTRYELEAQSGSGGISRDSVTVAGSDDGTLAHDGFDHADMDGWRVVTGDWQISGAPHAGSARSKGYLRPLPADGSSLILMENGGDWQDYRVTAMLENETIHPMGLVAYADDAAMYRLEFDTAAHRIRLVRQSGAARKVLAEQSAIASFDMPIRVDLAVGADGITAALEGRTLFGGRVEDPQMLPGGTVGLFREPGDGQFRVTDLMVRRGTLIADAGPDEVLIDRDGDGIERVALSTAHSSHAGGAIWMLNGAEVSGGEVLLPPGAHLLTLTQDLGEETDRSGRSVVVVSPDKLLVDADFTAAQAAPEWAFVDEGELGEASAWDVVDAGLIQTANRYSRQLMGTGDTAPDGYWGLIWSPLGDGFHSLRKGAYALYDTAEARDWQDYEVATRFTAPSGGAVGLLVQYQDADNYTKLELDPNGGASQLVTLRDGIEQIQWQDRIGYDLAGANDLRLRVQGGVISAWLGGAALFPPIGLDPEARGTVALYTWGAPDTAFTRVTVRGLNH